MLTNPYRPYPYFNSNANVFGQFFFKNNCYFSPKELFIYFDKNCQIKMLLTAIKKTYKNTTV